MDPYSSFGYSPVAQASSGMSRTMMSAVAVCCLLLIGVGVYMMRSSGKNSKDIQVDTTVRASKPTTSTAYMASGKSSSKAGGQVIPDDDGPERRWNTDPPEAKLANFAFESKTVPAHVPDTLGKLVRKPAGNPPYKLVACNAVGGYAIRWNGRYLTVRSPSALRWTEEKEEPGSCFKLVPGYCGEGNNWVMIRSMANKMFVRPDGPSNALVCKDVPTARTAASYCWKLNPETAKAQPCGQIYSYDLGRIVDVPCNVKDTPDAGQSCSTVTKGYQAACCIKKGTGATHDPFCESTIFPKVVGQPLQQAVLYIRTRRPDLALKPCPEPCTTQAVPVQNPNLVIIPYDARSMIVTSIPRRLV